jgi:hypothetical protein
LTDRDYFYTLKYVNILETIGNPLAEFAHEVLHPQQVRHTTDSRHGPASRPGPHPPSDRSNGPTIKSFAAPKGGHLLNKPPDQISVGEIGSLLAGGAFLTDCAQNPARCKRADGCLTRYLWIEASQAMFTRLNQITFADLLEGNKGTSAENCLQHP